MATLDLQDNATLRMQAASEAGLESDDFGMENFTYANRAIVNTVFGHLEDTDFNGLVVSVLGVCIPIYRALVMVIMLIIDLSLVQGPLSFDDQGIREGGLQQVMQYRPGDDGGMCIQLPIHT